MVVLAPEVVAVLVDIPAQAARVIVALMVVLALVLLDRAAAVVVVALVMDDPASVHHYDTQVLAVVAALEF
jgi:hypothetical protein